MEFDVMVRADSWENIARLARDLESVGVSGMLFTETGQVPWMMIAAAAQAAPSLHYSTGIAVAFPRSPMISAQIAWELAANTKGRFRLGLGSQVKPHIVRRYGVAFDQPAKRMRDYILAVKACLRAFRGEGHLDHRDAHPLLLREEETLAADMAEPLGVLEADQFNLADIPALGSELDQPDVVVVRNAVNEPFLVELRAPGPAEDLVSCTRVDHLLLAERPLYQRREDDRSRRQVDPGGERLRTPGHAE